MVQYINTPKRKEGFMNENKNYISIDDRFAIEALLTSLRSKDPNCQVGAVLVIYILTALFGLTAYLFIVDYRIGVVLLVILLISLELFVEYTSMISIKYRPILNLVDKIKRK